MNVCVNYAGTLWAMLLLSTLPSHQCNPVCATGCKCNSKGAVLCVGDITDIPQQLPTHTYLLQLFQTKMQVINERSLANHNLVLRFSLTYSHLHTIHPMAFHVAPQLMSVKLSSNDLSVLPARVFSPLAILEQLHLDGNQLETLAPDMLEGLVMLLDLDLSRNKLDNLPADVFDGLTKLTFLNLGRNNIRKLPPTIFQSLTQLQKLMIYNNEIQELEAGLFDRLDKLEELKLHSNNISSLPPRVFWSLRNLRILTLSSNNLETVPEKSFYNMPKLNKLTLYKNPLLFLPDQLMGYMPDMTEFYLYSTDLTTVPGNLFANMSGLFNLSFHFNERLSELPSDLFCCLPKLDKLSLKSNNLVHLPPGLFSRLPTLSILLLNDNKLQSLPEGIFLGLEQLLELDLKNNNLQTLPGDTFSSNTVLKHLTLQNPWNCTCSIRGIAKWIRHNVNVVVDSDVVICHSPENQIRRTVGSLSDEEFNFCDAVPKESNQHEPTSYKPTHIISTRGQTKKAPVMHTTAVPTPLPTSTTSQTKSIPVQAKATKTHYNSAVSFDIFVFEDGPEYVHHSRRRGGVYVWFLPSDTTMLGIHMFCHILLVITALVLILATIYGMCRLNNTMIKLNSWCAYTRL